MALIAILLLTCAVLVSLQYLPGGLRPFAGPRHLTMAIMLPVIATFGLTWPLFAAGVLMLAIYAPAVTPAGIALPDRANLALRANMFMFALPLMPMLTYTIAFGGLTVVQLTYVNLIAAALFIQLFSAANGRWPSGLARWDQLFLLMLVVQILMDVRGDDLTFGLRMVLIVSLNLGLPYFAVSRCIAAGAPPHGMLMALLVAGCVLAALATCESLRFWLLYDGMGNSLGTDFDPISGYTKQRGGLLRARATFGESTGLSLFLGVMLVMLVALRRQVASRVTLLAAGAMLMTGLVFTFARVGYIALIAGVPAIFVAERRWGALLKTALALPLAALLLTGLAKVVPLLSASVGSGDDAAGSVDYRSELMRAGLAMVREHPLLGQSITAIYAQLAPLRNGESIIDLVNQPLVIVMRAGVIGGTLYFLLFAAVLWGLFREAPRMAPEARAAAVACFASLIALMASLITTSYGRNEITYVVLLAAGAGLIARVRAERGATLVPRQASIAVAADTMPGRLPQPIAATMRK